MNYDVVVIGSGPGGYSAAFRLADLGLNVALVEKYENIGGVCLNVGCIPSKAFLHYAETINNINAMKGHGLNVGKISIDIDKMREFKNSTNKKLVQGLFGLAAKRKVKIITGFAKFTSKNSLEVGKETINFKSAIIAVGSSAIMPGFIPEDPRIFNSTGALNLNKTTGSMIVLGGGIIGCEMATIYQSLGCDVSVVEMQSQIMPGADEDLVKPVQKIMESNGTKFMLNTKVTKVIASKKGIEVSFDNNETQIFDQMLVSIGRSPNGGLINAEAAGVNVDDRGFISVDSQMRTNIENIFAIGDVIGQPMLAHKAVAEGHVAAEVIAGHRVKMDALCIPSVAYTDPEVAWVGKTEHELKSAEIKYEKGVFPWAASGRAMCLDRTEGFTKILFDAKTDRILGAGIVGRAAGDLISELALAIEMGCVAEDLAKTIHPHPTLSESVMMASEMYLGTITDLIAPKRRKLNDKQ